MSSRQDAIHCGDAPPFGTVHQVAELSVPTGIDQDIKELCRDQHVAVGAHDPCHNRRASRPAAASPSARPLG